MNVKHNHEESIDLTNGKTIQQDKSNVFHGQ